MKEILHTEWIWEIEGFLSTDECEKLIIFSEMRGYEEAEVSLPSGSRMMKSIRDNYRLLCDDPQLAGRLWEKLRPFIPEEVEGRKVVGLNERFRFYRYEPGQRFKRHVDGSFRRENGEKSEITFLVYLNDDFQGGETEFDDVLVRPKRGNALLFFHKQKHEGKAVLEGIKYVLRSDVMYL